MGPCDKCDGAHSTDVCPYFKKGREKHRDAWEGYKKPDADRAETSAAASAAAAARQLHGATIVKQPGDGSCLFHSLAYGAGKLGGAAAELCNGDGVRVACLRFIERNPSTECAGVPLKDWVEWESGLEPSSYCERMRKPGAWGGAIELLVFSRLTNASVHVYERRGQAFEQISAFDVPQPEHGPKRFIRVLYSGRSHYDALTVEGEAGRTGSRL